MLKQSSKRQAARWLALAGVSAMAAAAVQAADPTPAQNGVMTFPNVRVVTMPAAAKPATARPAESQAGFTAYIDPATGQLVQPTAEQAAALQAAGNTRFSSAQAAAAPTMIYLPQGGVGMVLDESQNSNFVVRKDADGKLVEVCVPGDEAARAALKAPATGNAKAAAKGEVK